jgi:hypothetical protein
MPSQQLEGTLSRRQLGWLCFMSAVKGYGRSMPNLQSTHDKPRYSSTRCEILCQTGSVSRNAKAVTRLAFEG